MLTGFHGVLMSSSSPAPPAAYSELATQSLCPDLASLANVFIKNKLGFSSQAKAPISVIKPYLALSFVRGQAFLPSSLRDIVPLPCLLLGPFTTDVKGVRLSCSLSTNTTAPVQLAAVSTHWHVGVSSIVRRTFPGASSPQALPPAPPHAAATFQSCGSFAGHMETASQMQLMYARVGINHDDKKAVSKFVSASFNKEHGVFKAFFGQKDIFCEGSSPDFLGLDAEGLQDFARTAPRVELAGLQFGGDKSGVAAVVRASLLRIDGGSGLHSRTSLKLPIFWTSDQGTSNFSYSIAFAQRVTLSVANYQHSCCLGVGLKFKNWAVSPHLYYF